MRALTRRISTSEQHGRGPVPRIATIGATAMLAVALGAGSAGALALAAAPAGAQTTGTTRYVAVGGNDGGGANDCTLQAAPCATVQHAIAEAAAGDRISIGTGTFYEADLTVAKNLTIEGAGLGPTTINGSKSSNVPILTVQGNVSGHVDDLTLAGGANEFPGGAISVGGSGADVTISHVEFFENSGGIDGGAIYAYDSTVRVTDSVFLNNSTPGQGGAIYAYDGTVNLDNTAVASNTAGGDGGGLAAFGSVVQVQGSAFQTNSAVDGGAIYLGTDTSSVGGRGNATATTFFANRASGLGGSVFGAGGGFGAYHDSFEANTSVAADAVYVDSGAAAFQTSVLDDAPGAADKCAVVSGLTATSVLLDDGNDLSDDATCNFTGIGSSGSVTPARLGLATSPGPNGGFVGTLRIGPASAAYEIVPAAFCAGDDARGVPYLQGSAAACDAGAFQYAPPVITGVSPGTGLPTGGTAVTLSGSGFTLVSAATVGAQTATIEPGGSDTSLDLETPPGATGPAALTLYNDDSSVSTTITYVAASLTLATAPSPPVAGTVTLTETVSPQSEASGTVAFSASGTPIAGCAAVTVTGGRASCTTILHAGTDAIGAAITEAGATYPAPTDELVVGKATPSGSLTASPTSAASGAPVTLTADVGGQAIAPTGTVTFEEGSTPIASCGAVALAGGRATCPVVLAGGTHELTAAYSGSADYLSAASAAVPLTVGAAGAVVGSGSGSVGPFVRVRQVSGPRHGVERVLLACTGTACRGTLTLSTTPRVTVARGTRTETIVIAKVRYSLARDTAKTIQLRLDALGSHLVAGATGHRVVATLGVRVAGGSGTNRRVSI